MGTVRVLGASGHSMAIEKQNDPAVASEPEAPAAGHTAMASDEPSAMVMTGGPSGSQLAAVTLLTLLLLGAGVVLADLSGGFEAGPKAMMDMP